MAVRVLQGHVLDVLATLPEKSVHVVCTSPPYWNLRNYGTPPQVWGGAEGCAHVWGDPVTERKRGDDAGATARCGNTRARVCPPETQQGRFCRSCRAWLGELGSEPALDLFVAHLVEVFAAVRRVLRDDGTLWVNLGDSYVSTPTTATTPRAAQGDGTGVFRVPAGRHVDARRQPRPDTTNPLQRASGLKPGDLCLVPARFALAMQDAGWLLRSEMTLCKRAPMPEPVQGARWERCRRKVARSAHADPLGRAGWQQMRESPERHQGIDPGWLAEWADCPGCPRCAATDGYVQRWGSGRPTSAVEKLFLFAKAGHRYFYDLEAVRQPLAAATVADGQAARGQRGTRGEYAAADGNAGFSPAGRNLWNWLPWPEPEVTLRDDLTEAQRAELPARLAALSAYFSWGEAPTHADHLEWAPEPLKDAHYAAYPRWLPGIAIRAGTSERGVCPHCGAPWLRIVDRRFAPQPDVRDPAKPAKAGAKGLDDRSGWAETPRGSSHGVTRGWRSSCACPPHAPVPATVLDPFAGSGTTLVEANARGRHGVGIELQERYVAIAHRRLSGQPVSLFAWEGQGALERPPEPAEEPPIGERASDPDPTEAGSDVLWGEAG
jgi:DNA modification methylase